MRDPITVSQAAVELGVCARHVRDLIRDHAIPHVQVNPRLILLERSALDPIRARAPRGRPKKTLKKKKKRA